MPPYSVRVCFFKFGETYLKKQIHSFAELDESLPSLTTMEGFFLFIIWTRIQSINWRISAPCYHSGYRAIRVWNCESRNARMNGGMENSYIGKNSNR